MDSNSTNESDEAFFEWALAHFRQNAVNFSGPPADCLPWDIDAAGGGGVSARRKRLDRLN
jgi:hypothetical protein